MTSRKDIRLAEIESDREWERNHPQGIIWKTKQDRELERQEIENERQELENERIRLENERLKLMVELGISNKPKRVFSTYEIQKSSREVRNRDLGE